MKILYAASEVVPYSKTGGLADVAGSLPDAIATLGHEVVVVSPLYPTVKASGRPITALGKGVEIDVDGVPQPGELHEDASAGPARQVFVEHEGYFGREGLYGDAEGDHEDNAARFAFFSRAVLAATRTLGFYPDVIHANDWQTALIPVYLRTLASKRHGIRNARTVLTIHNLAYQGLFPRAALLETGLPERLFNWRELEFHEQLCFLKGGIVFADHVTTVSRTYADEIRTEAHGCGLEGLLTEISDRLTGIPNGIDHAVWDPSTDSHLAARYDRDDMAGKAECKRALQSENGLAVDASTPVIGMITRLAEQKGVDLVADALDAIVALGYQFVLLGTGQPEYHERFEALAEKHAGRIGVHLKFSNAMAHRIEAGADLFLMPSRYEPCGLNQLYSLRFGTVPVVRDVGGLADTVTDATSDALEKGTGTGFVIPEHTPEALVATLERALGVYRRPEAWEKLRQTGMDQDWSWARSAALTAELYPTLFMLGPSREPR